MLMEAKQPVMWPFIINGDVGQNEDDRIVSGYTYENVVIPQVECINESQYIALRDDGFSTYQGNQIPKESKTVNVKQEIVSTFFDEDRIGLVFKNNNKDDLYTMEVYNMSGQLKFRKNFNVPYTTIKMSGGNIVMYNSSQICVMNSGEMKKYIAEAWMAQSGTFSRSDGTNILWYWIRE